MLKTKTENDSFASTTWEFFDSMCANTSTHGGNWLSRINNPCLKALYLIMILALQIGLLVIFFGSFIQNHPAVYTVTKWNTSVATEFPSFIICNPGMFKFIYLLSADYAELNLTPRLLTYLQTSVNELSVFEHYQEFMDNWQIMEKEYQAHNFSSDNMLKDLSIKCEDFFIRCSEQLVDLQCCGDVIQPEPYFSATGVCFKSKRTFVTRRVGFSGQISLVVNASMELTASYDPTIVSGKAAFQGAIAAIYKLDHPISALKSRSILLDAGTSTTILLELSEIDRTALASLADFNSGQSDINTSQDEVNHNSCVSESALIYQFLVGQGFPHWTSLNCHDFFSTQIIANCSMLKSFGIVSLYNTWDEEDSINGVSKNKTCTPNDILSFARAMITNDDIISRRFQILEYYRQKVCIPGCKETNYKTVKSTINLRSKDLRDEVHFAMYFSNINKVIHIMKNKGMAERISETGGLMGMIIGASLISLVELAAFYMCFCLQMANLLRHKLFK